MNYNDYYMNIALAVRERANCKGRRVGAVIVRDNRIVSTGYNGTVEGMPNCLDGGCHRCANPEEYPAGSGYDVCVCVHAEQNAILTAARLGIALEGASMYTTLKPCFNCSKAMRQVKIESIFFLHDWVPNQALLKSQYDSLLGSFPGEVTNIDIPDPRADWAMNKVTKLNA
ncbi:MAG: dCMP deaminase family protein [bacterium]|nr:dCMP deaminase family protein [bacterium]